MITELQKINHPVTDVINTKKDVLKILYNSQHVDTIFSKSSIDNNNNKNGNRIR